MNHKVWEKGQIVSIKKGRYSDYDAVAEAVVIRVSKADQFKNSKEIKVELHHHAV